MEEGGVAQNTKGYQPETQTSSNQTTEWLVGGGDVPYQLGYFGGPPSLKSPCRATGRVAGQRWGTVVPKVARSPPPANQVSCCPMEMGLL